MPRSRPIRTSFAAGEWSPLLAGRVDVDKYLQAAQAIENLLVAPQGGLTRRPGTRYVARAKAQDYDPLLVPFEFGPDQSNVLEIGENYIRFFTLGGQVIVSATNTTLINGDFSDGLTAWTNKSSGGGSIALGFNEAEVPSSTGTAIGNMTGGGGLNAAFAGVADPTAYAYHRVRMEGGDPSTVWGIGALDFYDANGHAYSRDGGSVIGDFTVNSVRIFDNKDSDEWLVAAKTTIGGAVTVGRHWPSARIVTGFSIWGTADKGFKLETDPTIVFTLQASNNGTTWTTLFSFSHANSPVVKVTFIDDTITDDWPRCALSSGNVATIGKHWTSSKRVTGFLIRGSDSDGFKRGENPRVTVTLEGSNNNFSTVETLASASINDVTGPIALSVRSGVHTANDYTYHRLVLRGGNNLPFGVSQVRFWEASSSTGKLRLIPAAGVAAAEQAVTIDPASIGQPQVLSWTNSLHSSRVQVGTASGLGDVLAATTLGVGAQTITFVPPQSPVYLRFSIGPTTSIDESDIDSVKIVGDVPYEVATPYTRSDLKDLVWTQAADVMWLVHPRYEPRKLIRRGFTSWSLETVPFQDGPYRDINLDDSTTITASATGGTVTLTASDPIFHTGHIGSVWRLCATGGVPGADTWLPEKPVTSGDFRKYEQNVYRASSTGTTGHSPPVHERGTVSDGAVDWLFRNRAGWGWVKITAYSSQTQVTAEVHRALDPSVISDGTAVWREGAFSNYRGWPSAVSLTQGRLLYASGIAWFLSRVGLYDDFTPDGEDDDAVYGIVAAAIGSPITWAVDHDQVVLGCSRGAFTLAGGGGDTGDLVTPKSVSIRQQTASGANDTPPVKVDQAVLYAARSGERLYELSRAVDAAGNAGYRGVDITVLAEHILKPGVAQLAFSREPTPYVWATRADGQLACLTYSQAESVVAWSRQILGGTPVPGLDAAAAVAVTTIPGANQNARRDEVWLCARRLVAGVDVRFIEYLASTLGFDGDKSDAVFVDASVSFKDVRSDTLLPGDGADVVGATDITFTRSAGGWQASDVGRWIRQGRYGGLAEITDYFSSTQVLCEIIRPWLPTLLDAEEWQLSAQTFAGLDHLELERVRVLADGGEHPDCTVTDGAITLQRPAFEVVAGLAMPYRYQSLPIPDGAAAGTAIAAKKRVTRLYVGLVNSGECDVGFLGAEDGEDTLEAVITRPVTSIGEQAPLFTGAGETQLDMPYDRNPCLLVAGDGARPLTITHIVLSDLAVEELA